MFDYFSLVYRIICLIVALVLTTKFKMPKAYCIVAFILGFVGVFFIAIMGTTKEAAKRMRSNNSVYNQYRANVKQNNMNNPVYGNQNPVYGNQNPVYGNQNQVYSNQLYGNQVYSNQVYENQNYESQMRDNSYYDERMYEAKSYGKLNECESHDGGYETFESSYVDYNFEQPRGYVLNGEVVRKGNNCYHCGAPLAEGATYCDTCGSRA